MSDLVVDEVTKKAGDLDFIIEALANHDVEMLAEKASSLKGTDGEGWAVGELVFRCLAVLEGTTPQAIEART